MKSAIDILRDALRAQGYGGLCEPETECGCGSQQRPLPPAVGRLSAGWKGSLLCLDGRMIHVDKPTGDLFAAEECAP